MTVPTLNRTVERSVPFEITRAHEEGGDGLTFEGYAAIWNSPTRIDSWEGTFDEQIAPGAFKKTIRERTPVLQFDHGRHAIVGSIPIGAITELREDDKGLYVKARLAANWLIQPVREAIANGSISGMSFRFEAMKDEWFDKFGRRLTDEHEIFSLLYDPQDRGPIQRTLREVKCMELGPVVFPAYPDTTAAVRSQAVMSARAIRGDDELCRAIRGSLVAGRAVELPAQVAPEEVAAVLLFGERGADTDVSEEPAEEADAPTERTAAPESATPENETSDSERQTPDAMIGTPQLEGTETRSDPPVGSEAEAVTEPVLDHSENRAQDEPVPDHSEPENPPTFAEVRSTPSYLEQANAEERRAARQLAAAQYRTKFAKANERADRYS